MKIPVFISCPTDLSEVQEHSRKLILEEIDNLFLEPRALGRSDYPTDLPLREVFIIAKHCAGAVILGFEQFQSSEGIWKKGTDKERSADKVIFPTPWNNLEAGIIYSLGLPMLVFKEVGISGGVFDHGVTDVFVHEMPNPAAKQTQSDLKEVFLKWQAKVREFYYKV